MAPRTALPASDAPKKAPPPEERVQEGSRNDSLFRLASSLRGQQGLTEAAIIAAVQEENKVRCDPPLGEKEVETLCKSAGRYTPEKFPERGGTEQKPLRPSDFSDAGNAQVFAEQYRNDLIFTDALGWLWWTGQKWQRDDHKALAWAVELSGKMLQDAKQEHRDALHQQAEAKAKYAESGETAVDSLEQANAAVKRAKGYLTHAKNTRNFAKLRNMLELSKPALLIRAAQLDANPFDLNTPAGIVDLNTGIVRAHDRKAYCSRMTGAAPGSAGEQMWEEFLDTITEGDLSVKGFLQMVAGMALFGAVYHEGIILAYGGGRNGKSTFFNALGTAVGDYTGAMAVDTLTVTKNGNQGASLATLRGKQLVITGELEEHQRLSVAMLKRLASTDTLRIEEKYRAPEDITPSHSIVLFTNHLPRVGSTDNGTWRRLIVVPFNATIPIQEGIANFGEVLAQEAGPAILSWAIEGAVNFAQDQYKLDIPDAVAESTKEYREREDWLSNFIGERCEKGPNLRAGATELYSAYKDWSDQSGEYVRRLNDFNTAMETAGYHKIKPKNRSTWEGIRLDNKPIYSSCFSAP